MSKVLDQKIIRSVHTGLKIASGHHAEGETRPTLSYILTALQNLTMVVEGLVDAQPDPDPAAPRVAAHFDAAFGHHQKPAADMQPLLDQINNEIRDKANVQRGAWWQAQGSGSTVGARVTASHVNVEHPTVARIKFADGGVVNRDATQPTMTAAELEDLYERHTARISAKNVTIRSLEERIFNQRSQLAVLNEKQSENAQVMGWLAAIANADKDVEAGLAAGKALSEFAQTLRAA